MNRWILAAALAFPLAGLAVGIVVQETGERGATEWRIPVTGYDPRDPLRGRFITFRYAWTVSGPARLCRDGDCLLCLEQEGRHVRVIRRGGACPARVDPIASRIALSYTADADGQPLAATSRLFVSEASAPRIEALLSRGKTRPVVRARLTRDGRLINDAIEPGSE